MHENKRDTSEWIYSEGGIRQERVMSASLFNVLMDIYSNDVKSVLVGDVNCTVMHLCMQAIFYCWLKLSGSSKLLKQTV